MNEEQTRISTREVSEGEAKENLSGGEGSAGKKPGVRKKKAVARPEIEIRPIALYGDRYYVDRTGGVWSRYYACSKTDNWKQLKATLRDGEYKGVCLVKNKHKVTHFVHRLVAAAFIERVEGKNFVNHKNSITTDNRVENLEWCTIKENAQHCMRAGRNQRGESHTQAKLTYEAARLIRGMLANGSTQAHVSTLFNTSPSNVSRIFRNEIWTK